MELVSKFLGLFPRLLAVALDCTPFVYLIICLFLIGVLINLACYMFWGRYS